MFPRKYRSKLHFASNYRVLFLFFFFFFFAGHVAERVVFSTSFVRDPQFSSTVFVDNCVDRKQKTRLYNHEMCAFFFLFSHAHLLRSIFSLFFINLLSLCATPSRHPSSCSSGQNLRPCSFLDFSNLHLPTSPSALISAKNNSPHCNGDAVIRACPHSSLVGARTDLSNCTHSRL